jgi:hypothetical protein
MTVAVQVGGAWKEGTPEKVNVGGAWKPVTSAKVNIGGVWKDISLVAAGGILTNILYRKTGNTREFEFTAVGGSGTYFWDYDGPNSSNEGGAYGSNVVIYTYKSYGTKIVQCQDMGSAEHPEMAGTTVQITITV